jgi:hypothetical protein
LRGLLALRIFAGKGNFFVDCKAIEQKKFIVSPKEIQKNFLFHGKSSGASPLLLGERI